MASINEKVCVALGLDDRERSLVHDLVEVKLQLNDGKCGHNSIDLPSKEELRVYAARIKKELDGFLGVTSPSRHQVSKAKLLEVLEVFEFLQARVGYFRPAKVKRSEVLEFLEFLQAHVRYRRAAKVKPDEVLESLASRRATSVNLVLKKSSPNGTGTGGNLGSPPSFRKEKRQPGRPFAAATASGKKNKQPGRSTTNPP